MVKDFSKWVLVSTKSEQQYQLVASNNFYQFLEFYVYTDTAYLFY